MSAVVIIGGGQGGYLTAASLRQYRFTGSITLITDEHGLPYQRPPLSKAYLLGESDERRLLHRQGKWYADQDVRLVHDPAVAIDRAGHTVELASGARIPYDHLVIATGARNRALPVPGSDLEGVTGMRVKADADDLSSRLREGTKAIVVGAGFIGLEFASVAAARGADVHVFELGDRPMARAVSATTAEFFRATHEEWGVEFDFNHGLASIDGKDGRVVGVTTDDGRTLPADVVVYGIGVIPNTEIAEAAGLAVSNGIEVDERLVTSDPDISAVGDVVSFPCAQLGGAMTRLESVQNASDQARAVAARLTGDGGDYRTLPWFWSDQGHLKLQIAGVAHGYDHTVELPAEAGQKTVLCIKDGVLVAVETVNGPADHMIARRLLAERPELSPEEAAAEDFDFRAWADSRVAVGAR